MPCGMHQPMTRIAPGACAASRPGSAMQGSKTLGTQGDGSLGGHVLEGRSQGVGLGGLSPLGVHTGAVYTDGHIRGRVCAAGPPTGEWCPEGVRMRKVCTGGTGLRGTVSTALLNGGWSGHLLSGGGEGVWDPKNLCTKTARPDFPDGEFRFFPRWSLWSGGGGGVPLF